MTLLYIFYHLISHAPQHIPAPVRQQHTVTHFYHHRRTARGRLRACSTTCHPALTRYMQTTRILPPYRRPHRFCTLPAVTAAARRTTQHGIPPTAYPPIANPIVMVAGQTTFPTTPDCRGACVARIRCRYTYFCHSCLSPRAPLRAHHPAYRPHLPRYLTIPSHYCDHSILDTLILPFTLAVVETHMQGWV